ncbi:MAG: hypothetical protein U0235_28755 [Polyangiaceae bacterium]
MQTPRVAFGYSDAFRAHVMDADHPERPSRVDAARRGAARLGERVRPYPFGPASREALERVHHPRFVESVARPHEPPRRSSSTRTRSPVRTPGTPRSSPRAPRSARWTR